MNRTNRQSGAGPSAHWQRLRRRLLAEKKKASVLLVLVLVAGGLWLRTWLSPTAESSASSVPATDPAPAATATDNPAPVVSQPREPRVVEVDLPSTIGRNVFLLDTTGYELAPKSDVGGSDGAKSGGDGADDKPEVRTDGLHLQTTMLGRKPAAVINGEVIGIGDEYEEFKLIEVRPESVILEKNGVQVELSM